MSRQTLLQALLTPLIIFILLFAFLRIFGPIPFNVNNLNTNKTDSFEVSGIGEVDQKPDTAVISLGVQTQGTSVKTAQDSLNTSINSVTSAIKKQGIQDADIQTQNYSINPNYDFNSGTQKITGYTANTTLKIKVRDLSKINSVVDAATANGANQVGEIIFTVNDPTKFENQARDKAILEAKTRAETAARAVGFRLGRIISYSEDFGDKDQPIPMIQNAVKADTTTQIQPGSTTIRVEVFLNYEIY